MDLLQHQITDLQGMERDLRKNDFINAAARAGRVLEHLLKKYYREAIGNLPPAKQKDLTQKLIQNLEAQKASGINLNATDRWTLGTWLVFYKNSNFFAEYEALSSCPVPDIIKYANWNTLLKIRNKAAHEVDEPINSDEALYIVGQVRLMARSLANWKPSENWLVSFLRAKAQYMTAIFLIVVSFVFIWAFWIQPTYFPVVSGCAVQEAPIMSQPFLTNPSQEPIKKIGSITAEQCLTFDRRTKDKNGNSWLRVANSQFKGGWVSARFIEVKLREINLYR